MHLSFFSLAERRQNHFNGRRQWPVPPSVQSTKTACVSVLPKVGDQTTNAKRWNRVRVGWRFYSAPAGDRESNYIYSPSIEKQYNTDPIECSTVLWSVQHRSTGGQANWGDDDGKLNVISSAIDGYTIDDPDAFAFCIRKYMPCMWLVGIEYRKTQNKQKRYFRIFNTHSHTQQTILFRRRKKTNWILA